MHTIEDHPSGVDSAFNFLRSPSSGDERSAKVLECSYFLQGNPSRKEGTNTFSIGIYEFLGKDDRRVCILSNCFLHTVMTWSIHTKETPKHNPYMLNPR